MAQILNKPVVIILMVRKWLSLVLVALIALQSVAAIADAHQLHQAGTEHLEFEHDHGSKPDGVQETIEEKLGAPLASDFDCHHCCHCHGMAHLFLGSSNNYIDISQYGQKIFESRFAYLSYLISPDLRPPIV